MKIAITNNIALNGGDAAILLGMIKVLKLRFGEDTKFVVSGTYPEVCAHLYPDFKWCNVVGRMANTTPFNQIRVVGRIMRILKRYRFYAAAFLRRYNIPLYEIILSKKEAESLEEYATSDYIISSGGTYLIEPYGITSQYIDYRISLILGKPLVLYTQSMGPFTNSQTQKRLKWVFNRSNAIFLRDEKSKENVNKLNLVTNSNVYVVPDAAFALGDIETVMQSTNDQLGKKGNVAISVRDWIHTDSKSTMSNYRRCIADVVIKLVEMGYRVHFISTCQGISTYSDDNEVVDKILTLIPNKYHMHIVKYNEYLTIAKITYLLKQMDFIIATRLHMSILALISGTPVYPIAYEFKTIELYHSLGYKTVDTLESLNSSCLSESVVSFINNYTNFKRETTNMKVAEYIKNAMNVVNLIK